MKEIHVMDQITAIRSRPQIYFGKDEVNGFDLLWAIMHDVRKITGFHCVIHDDNLFVIHSHTDWISEHYRSHDEFLKTANPEVFDEHFSKGTLDFHYGILVYAYSTNIATVTGQYLVNHKGRLTPERLEALLKKYNLAEEGFYFIFSV